MAFAALGGIGAVLIGSILWNSLAPSVRKGEKVIYSERCIVRYSIFGILRLGAITSGFFSISKNDIAVKLVVTCRYKISEIKSVKLGRDILSPCVNIKLLHSIATIHLHSKNPDNVINIINEIREIR